MPGELARESARDLERELLDLQDRFARAVGPQRDEIRERYRALHAEWVAFGDPALALGSSEA